ncbi:hypothetical protein ASD81_07775 [Nocardioides sp. Root614]|nr:hypothetical protein ASD81_07775 [Nocardioides sp. Root614]KRA92472.1 hypothetical protein ASD84_08040 [Nocardioides sp. Root682]
MHHLRPTAIAGLLLALVPAAMTLSSCGFDYPTDRINTIAAGENNREASVDALGIRLLATATGEGRLIGSLSNNLDEDADLDTVTSPEGKATAKFKAVEVPGRGAVNLAADVVIPVTGDFTAGDVITLELGFSTGETVSLNVPVVKNCYQYTQIPTEAAESDSEESEPAEDEAGDGEAADAAAEEEHADGEHEEGGDARFNCSDEAPAPEGAH